MSRLLAWFGQVRKVKQRKRARYRAYRSEAIAVRMEQVSRKPQRKRRPKRR